MMPALILALVVSCAVSVLLALYILLWLSPEDEDAVENRLDRELRLQQITHAAMSQMLTEARRAAQYGPREPS